MIFGPALQDPPVYVPSEEESKIRTRNEKIIRSDKIITKPNPYDNEGLNKILFNLLI